MSDNPKPISNIQVLRLVRDARSTKGAQRQLLIALVLRANPHKKYACWPSYSQLADDTLLDAMTLKRAAKKLETENLIKRTIRANRSNVFYVNVALLQEQAAEVKRLEEQNKSTSADGEDSPFADPVLAQDPLDDATQEEEGGSRWGGLA